MAPDAATFVHVLDRGATTFVQRFFGVDGICPSCRSPFAGALRQRFLGGNRVKCHCGWRGIWRDGTPLDRSRLSDSQFVVLLLGLRWSVAPDQIARTLGVDPQTVRTWRDRLEAIRSAA